MFRKSLIAALIFATTSTTAQADIGERFLNFFKNDLGTAALRSRGKARAYTRPPASFTGQWFTTQDGCSYSRANPPGGRSTWHLIQNPFPLGQPNAHSGCVAMM